MSNSIQMPPQNQNLSETTIHSNNATQSNALQTNATIAQSNPTAASSNYKVLYTRKSKPYYLNTITNQTQWQKPTQLYKNPYKKHFLNFLAAHVQLDTKWNDFEYRMNSYYNNWNANQTETGQVARSDDSATSTTNTHINSNGSASMTVGDIGNQGIAATETSTPPPALSFDLDKFDINWKKNLFFRYKDLLREKAYLEEQRETERIKQLAFSIIEKVNPSSFEEVWEALNNEDGLMGITDEDKVELYESYVFQNTQKRALELREKNKSDKDAFYALLRSKYENGTLIPSNSSSEKLTPPNLNQDDYHKVQRQGGNQTHNQISSQNDSMKSINPEELLWSDIENQLKDTKEYASLDEVDRLEIWTMFIERASQEKYERDSKQRELDYPKHLHNRTKFWQHLMEQNRRGIINMNSKWEDVSLQLASEGNLIEKQYGPKPKDLFEEYIEDLKSKYREDFDKVKRLIGNQNIHFDTITIDNFKDVIYTKSNQENILLQLDDFTLREIYTYLKQEFITSKKRMVEQSFLQFLQNMDTIHSESTYEEVRSQIENQDVFKSVESEEERLSIFNCYLQELKKNKKRDRSFESDEIPPPKRTRTDSLQSEEINNTQTENTEHSENTSKENNIESTKNTENAENIEHSENTENTINTENITNEDEEKIRNASQV